MKTKQLESIWLLFLFPDVVLRLFAQRDFVGQETFQLIPLSSYTYILSPLP